MGFFEGNRGLHHLAKVPSEVIKATDEDIFLELKFFEEKKFG
jgi:hypothetical protein